MVGGMVGNANWINMTYCNSSTNSIVGDKEVGGVVGSLGK